ncbi:diacylglycerol kinase family enzyme [Rhizomicrobium palustre]|uniref:Diacylglycerol kinase family enzyme n=1 Tax=Rhizomicrobium palustre TaxID=189966 RepID=A0A846N3Q8_9PROT|nr:hypothetical protein [Rhizomicrobium palustre]NIK90366.1 diacylglycerol kinase family enzyme [Rhizomicrobium palustre]
MSAFVIVDPRDTGASRKWRQLEPKLASLYPYMSVAFLRRRGEAATLVSAALREGHSEIVAVGGTANEAVNGFFDAEGAVSPDAVLAVVGGEDESLTRLKAAPIRPIDIGRVRYLSRDGIPRTRYFASIASFGLSGVIVDAMNRSLSARLFGRRFGFGLHHALGMMTYRGRAVRLIMDRTLDEIVTISSVAVANGRIFGEPLELVPDAKPDDGQFDIVIMGQDQNGVMRVLQGRKLIAAPVEETHGRPVLVEIDGAAVGRLPATFEILPRALNVRC